MTQDLMQDFKLNLFKAIHQYNQINEEFPESTGHHIYVQFLVGMLENECRKSGNVESISTLWDIGERCSQALIALDTEQPEALREVARHKVFRPVAYFALGGTDRLKDVCRSNRIEHICTQCGGTVANLLPFRLGLR